MVSIQYHGVAFDFDHGEGLRLAVFATAFELTAHLHTRRKLALGNGLHQVLVAQAKGIGRVIRMLADRGDMAILLVEQYYDFAEALADDYLVMERGEFIARGQGQDMQANGVRQLVSI